MYGSLPKGPPEEPKPQTLSEKYAVKYMWTGRESPMRMSLIKQLSHLEKWRANLEPAIVHAILGLLVLGYSLEYYFHLRTCFPDPISASSPLNYLQDITRRMHTEH